MLEKQAPQVHHSFLIDAGAQVNGYASDITRTYSREENAFAEMIAQVDQVTKTIIEGLKPGKCYIESHAETHRKLADILVYHKVVNVTAEEAFSRGITRTFFPHGLGHHIGLQVHDPAGHFADDRGTPLSPPEAYPFLRNTRKVEAGQVVTIEPGLYFIDSLLNELKQTDNQSAINWDVVETFRPFGGIRIEDNVVIHRDRNENMTRDAGLC